MDSLVKHRDRVKTKVRSFFGGTLLLKEGDPVQKEVWAVKFIGFPPDDAYALLKWKKLDAPLTNFLPPPALEQLVRRYEGIGSWTLLEILVNPVAKEVRITFSNRTEPTIFAAVKLIPKGQASIATCKLWQGDYDAVKSDWRTTIPVSWNPVDDELPRNLALEVIRCFMTKLASYYSSPISN